MRFQNCLFCKHCCVRSFEWGEFYCCELSKKDGVVYTFFTFKNQLVECEKYEEVI